MSTLSRGGEILYILGRKCTAHHCGVATVELTQLAYQKWVVRMSVAVFGCCSARYNSYNQGTIGCAVARDVTIAPDGSSVTLLTPNGATPVGLEGAGKRLLRPMTEPYKPLNV